jgi:hypothetical protein
MMITSKQRRIEFKIQTKTKGELIMHSITENVSLKRLGWLAALPLSLAAFGASVVPAQASEHHRKEYTEYNSYTPKYDYCASWEHRYEYKCTGHYQPRYEESHYGNHHKVEYYHPKKEHHDSYHSEWKR